MSAVENTTPVVEQTTAVAPAATVAPKRDREEDASIVAGDDVTASSSSNMAGRPVPPPLKIVTTETTTAAVGPLAVGSPQANPHAPAPMVRIKSRASAGPSSSAAPSTLASPFLTSPVVSAGVGSLRINSPTVGLKINSPTATSASSAGARFGSPTSQAPKSPTRYGFGPSSTTSAAAVSATSDPLSRFTMLFTGLLTKDADTDKEEAKLVAGEIASALMDLDAALRPDRVKNLMHHLSDASNSQLRSAVYKRVISATSLVTMSTQDMLNPEKKKEVSNKLMWAEKDKDLKALDEAQRISSTMYKCPKCKKNDVTFYEKQTRSADEPMTQFITCNVCKYMWKIY